MHYQFFLQIFAALNQLIKNFLIVEIFFTFNMLLKRSSLAKVSDQIAIILSEIKIMEFYDVGVV